MMVGHMRTRATNSVRAAGRVGCCVGLEQCCQPAQRCKQARGDASWHGPPMRPRYVAWRARSEEMDCHAMIVLSTTFWHFL